MKSEKLVRILKAISPFTPDEIAAMSEAQGWQWVYAHAKPRKEKHAEICFTGFSAAEKAELSALATTHRFQVVKTVSQHLTILCFGDNAGPAKLVKARNQGAHILDREQFLLLLDTGELPGSTSA